jgi:hypothetical protein
MHIPEGSDYFSEASYAKVLEEHPPTAYRSETLLLTISQGGTAWRGARTVTIKESFLITVTF